MILSSGHPKLLDPKLEVVSLVPNSGIQMLDFVLDERKARAHATRFHDVDGGSVAAAGSSTVQKIFVHPMQREQTEAQAKELASDELTWRSVIAGGPERVAFEDTYSIPPDLSLAIFDRQWLPIPFLYLTNNKVPYDDGPTNWARAYVASPRKSDPEGTPWRVVIAFDTELLPRLSGRAYVAPTPEQAATADNRFALPITTDHQIQFARGSWQYDWIKAAYDARARAAGGSSRLGAPWACYVAYLQAIQAGCSIPLVTVLEPQPYSQNESVKRDQRLPCIDVDLVLDVGNSRTCGILVEQGLTDESIGIGQPPARLELRDFARPERVYDEPFESRVEFQPVQFGMTEYSRRSQRARRDAFWWPSALRVGPEAAWLASLSDGRDGVSGSSSPKRYVWDRAKRPQSWVYSRAERSPLERLPPIRSPITALLTEDGKPPKQGEKTLPAVFEPKYSRGSMYMLMLAEVLCHAFAQINSISYRTQRANPDVARRLRKIIITLPSATPAAEHAAMRKHADAAIRLLWRVNEWEDKIRRPELSINWDEATCTQLVYLYNELEHRFQRFPAPFFELMGRRRGAGLSLRIASLDIGGGTTDLMIIDHELEDEVITPRQLFREGFRQAGDDIVKELIEKSVIPAIVAALRESGVTHPEQLASFLFGGDGVDITREEQIRRALFVNQVLVPAALYLIGLYEKTDEHEEQEGPSVPLSDVLPMHSLRREVVSYLEDAARKRGGHSFQLGAVRFAMRPAEIAGAIQSVMGAAIEDLCDVVRAYECDVLLVTGRPSAMPAIRHMIRANAPVAAHRIVPMYGYRVGNWYPFRSADSRIWDPKTTAAVGALLCHRCSGKHAASFFFAANALTLQSTARYIGKMDQAGQIGRSAEVVAQAELGDTEAGRKFTVSMASDFFLGYRQLPIERWVTSPLYYIYFRDESTARSIPRPVTVYLQRHRQFVEFEPEREADSPEDRRRQQEQQVERESITVEKSTYREGGSERPCEDGVVNARLQTLRTSHQVDAGYWLDSGVLSLPHIVEADHARS